VNSNAQATAEATGPQGGAAADGGIPQFKVEDVIDPIQQSESGAAADDAGAGQGTEADPGPGNEPPGDGEGDGDDGGSSTDGTGDPGNDGAQTPPPGGGGDDDPGKTDEGLVKRFYTSRLPQRERLILDHLARNRDAGMTLEEATAFVDGKYPALRPAKQETGGGTDPEAAILADIQRLETDMDKASDDVDLKAHGRAVRDLIAKREELATLRARRESARSAEQVERVSLEESSKIEAVRLFPEAGQAGSALAADVQAEIERLEAVNPGFFNDPEWPLTVTSKVAARRGRSPATNGQSRSTAAVTSRTIAPRQTTTGPVPARRTASAPPVQVQPEEARRLIATANPRELQAFLRRAGTRPVGAGGR
jgi:hypothetical protein